jgi:hypothetical protein
MGSGRSNNSMPQPLDTSQPLMENFHQKKSIARKEILAFLACDIHGLPDKPAACWKDPVQQLCYPVTDANINLWVTLHVGFQVLFKL